MVCELTDVDCNNRNLTKRPLDTPWFNNNIRRLLRKKKRLHNLKSKILLINRQTLENAEITIIMTVKKQKKNIMNQTFWKIVEQTPKFSINSSTKFVQLVIIMNLIMTRS